MPGNIKVTVTGTPLQVPKGSPIDVQFVDKSGCKVDATLILQDLVAEDFHFKHAIEAHIQHQYSGYDTAGNKKCGVSFRAFTDEKLLTRAYDVELLINAVLIAKIKGTVPKDPGFDRGFGDFAIKVI